MNNKPLSIDDLKIGQREKFDPTQTVWVLIHKDHTHFHSLPNGEINWDYNKANMDLVDKILEKDFGNRNYIVMKLADAFPLFCNVQAELVKLWTPTINLIRKERDFHQRRAIYERFYNSKRVAHPIEADALLKRLLKY